jgi:serine phosphatase RsbU (regulator of sigma subunit)
LITGSVSGAIKTSLTLVHRLDMAPAESLRTIAQEINHVVQVTGHDSGRLMTMLFCCLDLREQRLFYLNAGHLNFFHRHAGHWRPQLTAGSMLGMTQQPRWKVKECSLSVDDELVFFTDGLIENSNVAQQTLSVNAVLRTLQGLNSNSAEQTVQELMEQAHQLWQDVSLDDDVTVVCLRIKAFAAADRDTSWLQIVEPQSS